jgi:hypothetical protein
MKRGKKGELRVSAYPVLELEMTTARRRKPFDVESNLLMPTPLVVVSRVKHIRSIHLDSRRSGSDVQYLKSKLLPSP